MTRVHWLPMIILVAVASAALLPAGGPADKDAEDGGAAGVAGFPESPAAAVSHRRQGAVASCGKAGAATSAIATRTTNRPVMAPTLWARR